MESIAPRRQIRNARSTSAGFEPRGRASKGSHYRLQAPTDVVKTVAGPQLGTLRHHLVAQQALGHPDQSGAYRLQVELVAQLAFAPQLAQRRIEKLHKLPITAAYQHVAPVFADAMRFERP